MKMTNAGLDLDRYLKPSKIAESLNVSRAVVHELLNKGEIPSIRIGKMRRIKERDFQAYLERSKA